ncbi:MAG: carotenoid 1,2-hydratase, partial [Gammaproteobacteria bacterium]|nr:carotenoid 1,2-hydratase [Gammaproteobacteria bacterium]
MKNSVIKGFVAIAIFALLILTGCSNDDDALRESATTDNIDMLEAMSDEEDGFKRVLKPRTFSFPLDHGPHPDYKTEWWYVTGNLETEQGRRFGYQLTLFRVGLVADTAVRESAWGSSEVYMGHFALTDHKNSQFHSFERFSRAALGLAGAQSSNENQPFKVWLEQWRIEGSANEFLPLTLNATAENVSIAFTLNSDKPIVLQGDRGLSQKSADPGNASYYYSMTHMPTHGTITIDGESFTVDGNSWLDREWSTSALGENQAGWDWFALQLSDGRDLMFYRLRNKDGSTDPFSTGSLVAADGTVTRLTRDDVKLTIEDKWQSPKTQTAYPIHWRLQLAKYNLDLSVKAIQPNQEMLLSVQYWEGAVDV